METEVLDKLYLELSQFTAARTQRELRYEAAMREALKHLKYATPKQWNGPTYQAVWALEKALEE